MPAVDRRTFLTGLGAASLLGCATGEPTWHPPAAKPFAGAAPTPVPYPDDRPNVILVRFGGGVRRRETISDPSRTYCPFILKELAQRRGVLFDNVEIAGLPGIETSHSQGTLYLLTGEYRAYTDITGLPFFDRFECPLPTLPEYLRRTYSDIADHHALILNGEDRPNNEFFGYGSHHDFGVAYRSSVLGLHGYKMHLLRRRLQSPTLTDTQRHESESALAKLAARDYRVTIPKDTTTRAVEAFYDRRREHYGDTILTQPRGDRLLTSLAIQALKELRPRFLMINYQDTDYVHWGPSHFYTRAISVIDEGVREIVAATEADPFYRDRTVFVVVPDCGRDAVRSAAVPYQHHFNTRSSREVFAVVSGPVRFVPRSATAVSRPLQHIAVAATVGELMGFAATEADAGSLLGAA